jgi:hypothetical protein
MRSSASVHRLRVNQYYSEECGCSCYHIQYVVVVHMELGAYVSVCVIRTVTCRESLSVKKRKTHPFSFDRDDKLPFQLVRVRKLRTVLNFHTCTQRRPVRVHDTHAHARHGSSGPVGNTHTKRHRRQRKG